MKKLINDVDDVLAESLDGFATAHADIVTLGAERKFVRRAVLKPGKVALISGGGSGHEPLHAGFVGHGMLDAACPGQVFTSPTPDQMLAAAEAVDSGAGVLFIVKNYSGDMMNFQMAAEMLDQRQRDRHRQRRRRGRELDLHHRPARRRRDADRREDRRRRGRARRRPGGAEGARRQRQQGDRVDGRGADVVHRSRGRQADVPDRQRRDGDGRRHPRRARPAPRQARLGATRSPRELVGVDPEGPVAGARPGGDPARQRLRRHAAARALPDGQRRAQGPRRRRGQGRRAT